MRKMVRVKKKSVRRLDKMIWMPHMKNSTRSSMIKRMTMELRVKVNRRTLRVTTWNCTYSSSSSKISSHSKSW